MSEAINTRVELLAEAIETYVNVVTVGKSRTLMGDEARKQFELQQLARRELGNAIRICLSPVLRVASSNPQTIEHIPAPDARPVYPAA